MLVKLLKYEIKATGRVFLPLYLGLIVAAFLASFALVSSFDIFNVTAMFLLFALYVAVVIVTVVLLIQRFYQNLLKEEGYLMFTLPVSPSSLILSKLITTCMWCFASVGVGAAAALIASRNVFGFGEVIRFFTKALADEPYLPYLAPVFWLVVLAGISQLVFTVIQVYFSLAVGQLPPFGRHKILFAILVYLATSAIIQTTAMSLGAILMRLYPMPEVMSITNGILLGATAFNLFFAAAMFAATAWILKKKLNLE